MNIRCSLALALVSSLSVFACSGGAELGDPAPANEPTPAVEAPPAPIAPPQGRSAHRLAPASRLSGTAAVADMHPQSGELTTVSTDATTYAYCDPITVTFTNMPGNAKDWIDFAPAGSASTVYSWDAYTNSLGTSSTVTTSSGDCLPPGTYVARAFPNDTYTVIAESASFTVGEKPSLSATVALDKTTIGGFENVTATITGATANTSLFVSVSQPYGSTDTLFAGKYVQSNSDGAATVQLGDVVAGDFEVRVFEGNTWTGTSQTFHVDPAVKTDKTTYTQGDLVQVDFAGMQALTVNDSVALATAGSASDAYLSSPAPALVNWYWSGSKTFSTTGLAPGSYVARVFFDFSTTKQAESVQFTVTAP